MQVGTIAAICGIMSIVVGMVAAVLGLFVDNKINKVVTEIHNSINAKFPSRENMDLRLSQVDSRLIMQGERAVAFEQRLAVAEKLILRLQARLERSRHQPGDSQDE